MNTVVVVAAEADDALAAAVANAAGARVIRPDDLPSGVSITVDVTDDGQFASVDGLLVSGVLDRLPQPWGALVDEDAEWIRAETVATWVALLRVTPRSIGGAGSNVLGSPAHLDPHIRAAATRSGFAFAPHGAQVDERVAAFEDHDRFGALLRDLGITFAVVSSSGESLVDLEPRPELDKIDSADSVAIIDCLVSWLTTT